MIAGFCGVGSDVNLDGYHIISPSARSKPTDVDACISELKPRVTCDARCRVFAMLI